MSKWDREDMHPNKGTALDASNNEVDLIDPLLGAEKASMQTLRQDTPVEDTDSDGDPQRVKTDDKGHVWVHEGYVPGAVDNEENVMAGANKPNIGTAYAWGNYQSQAAEASEVVKASPGKFRRARIVITEGAATDKYYVHLVDATAVPPNGAVTLKAEPLEINHTNGTQSNGVIEVPDPGRNFLQGIVIYVSTTEISKTIAGNVALFTVDFI